MKSLLTTVAMIALVLSSVGASEAAGATVPLSPILLSRFTLHVGGCATDLGTWARVSGLGDSWVVSARAGGDASNHRWYLPGNSKLSTVKLTRAAGSDSQLVKDWLSDASFTRTAVTITLIGLAGQPRATWALSNALPAKWSVTGFDAGASKVALETLELSHQGVAPAAPCSARAS